MNLWLWPLRFAWRKLTGGHASGGQVPRSVVVPRDREGFCGRCGWDAPPGDDVSRLIAFMHHVEERHRPRPGERF